MKIIFTNNVELYPLTITGEHTFFQGADRDMLTFIFSTNEDLIALDKAFTTNNCESIKIIDDNNNESIHKAYTLRVKLQKAPIEIVASTPETKAVIEDRIVVSMAQRTYTETQLVALNALLTGEE